MFKFIGLVCYTVQTFPINDDVRPESLKSEKEFPTWQAALTWATNKANAVSNDFDDPTVDYTVTDYKVFGGDDATIEFLENCRSQLKCVANNHYAATASGELENVTIEDLLDGILDDHKNACRTSSTEAGLELLKLLVGFGVDYNNHLISLYEYVRDSSKLLTQYPVQPATVNSEVDFRVRLARAVVNGVVKHWWWLQLADDGSGAFLGIDEWEACKYATLDEAKESHVEYAEELLKRDATITKDFIEAQIVDSNGEVILTYAQLVNATEYRWFNPKEVHNPYSNMF